MTNEANSTLTGAAYDLASAGYASMPDSEEKDEREAIAGDDASLREAATRRSERKDDVVVRKYLDSDGQPAAANEAISLSRAGRDYGNAIAAEKLVVESESSSALAARVDALRAEALANDPDAAETYGFDLPETKPGSDESDKAKPEQAARDGSDAQTDSTVAGLDPELERALQHPQVRQAIEQQLNEAESTRQTYLNGLAAATQIAQVSFLGQFPELAGLAPEHLPAALEQLSREDPPKFARVQAIVASAEHLIAEQKAESGRLAELERRNFETYAQSEDARFETMMKGEARETQAAVAAEIMASAKASGVEPAELNRLFNSEPLMRNAIFQRMMYDAGKYRLMMKAKDAAVARALPPVQRPGSARTAGERERTDLRTLSARLSGSGDIKDAVALYRARKSNQR